MKKASLSFKTEAEIGEAVAEWLRSDGWTVYAEVVVGDRRADIVAVRGPVVWVIECKKSLGFAVYDQALRWRGFAHLISVAVPSRKGKARRRSPTVCFLASRTGIGVIEAAKNYASFEKDRALCSVYVAVSGEFARPRLVHRLREALCEEQLSQTPGDAGGGFITPFARTCRSLVRYVSIYPGVTMKEAVEHLDHHYASDKSARASIAGYIRGGVLSGVRLEDGRLYPHEEEK